MADIVASGLVGIGILFNIHESYGQSTSSGVNVTTTDKPDSEKDESGLPVAMIVGPIIGGFFVIWAVTMMCRDFYHKGRFKWFFNIVCCVHCKERCKKARVKPTKTNNKKTGPVALRPRKAIDRKDQNTNKLANEPKTTNGEKFQGRSRPKSAEMKHKTVTFKISRDLSPPRMTSYNTNVGSKPGTLSDRLPPIESTKADDRFKNSHTTNEHPVVQVSNWDDLLKSSNNNPHKTVEGPHSVPDTQYDGYVNSGFSTSTSNTDPLYSSTNRFEPVKLEVENDYPTKVRFVDDIDDLSEKPIYEDPGQDFNTPKSPNSDSDSITDDGMSDDSISLSSASGDVHYVPYRPPTDPPPVSPSFAKTPPPPSINVIIQDITASKSTPKAPPPSYDEALFYGSEPK